MTAFHHSHPYRPLSRRYNTGKNTVLPKRNYCKTILHHYFQIQQKSYVRKRALHLPRYLYLILLKVFSMIQGMLAIWSLVPLPLQKQGSSRKTSTSASLTMLKPLTAWITINCGKYSKRWECQTTLPISWQTCMWVKKQQLEPNTEQMIGLKLGNEYKAVYCHLVYLTSMQSTSYEMLD